MKVSSRVLLVCVLTWCAGHVCVHCQSCTPAASRTSNFTQLQHVTSLRASRLYTTPLTSRLRCMTHCTHDVNCYYVTVDTAANQCSFYSLAPTYVNVTGAVYAVVLENVQFSDTECDACASGPCQNSGTCVNDMATSPAYTCFCKYGFTGLSCETNINECASQPCQNGATCVDQVDGYTCQCVAGYTGLYCQTNINECASTPCQNGATCVDGVNSFTCQCLVSFTGIRCQTSLDYCLSSPCQNGGTCVNSAGSYTCTCSPVPYYGPTCASVRSVSSWCVGNAPTFNDAGMAGSTGYVTALNYMAYSTGNPYTSDSGPSVCRLQAQYGAAGSGNLMGAGSAYNVFALTANEVFTQIIVGFGHVNCGGQTYSALCSIDVTSNQRHVGSTNGQCSGVITTTVQFFAGLAYIGGRTDYGCITGLVFFYYN